MRRKDALQLLLAADSESSPTTCNNKNYQKNNVEEISMPKTSLFEFANKILVAFKYFGHGDLYFRFQN